jgi:signal transduction histidine kinase
VALVVAAIAGLAIGLLLTGLPADWRAATAVGAMLAAIAIAIGAPLLARARRELQAARRLFEIASGELARVNDDLRRTAAARDRALGELRASVEERQLFLNSIAHELNSPLTVIQGHLQLLTGRLARDDPPEREQLARGLNRMSAGVQQLAGLVEEFLWLARLDINEPVALERRPTDLVALVRSVAAAQAATSSRHRVSVEAERDRLVGQWDPRRLGRAVGNLIANAIAFSPHGGEVRVTVGLEPRGDVALVAVRDEGIGVAESELPHLFERFYRGERAKAITSGTGLGLTAVKHGVEAHGGTVTVQSSEGSGATFTIRLPLDAPGSSGGTLPGQAWAPGPPRQAWEARSEERSP